MIFIILDCLGFDLKTLGFDTHKFMGITNKQPLVTQSRVKPTIICGHDQQLVILPNIVGSLCVKKVTRVNT